MTPEVAPSAEGLIEELYEVRSFKASRNPSASAKEARAYVCTYANAQHNKAKEDHYYLVGDWQADGFLRQALTRQYLPLLRVADASESPRSINGIAVGSQEDAKDATVNTELTSTLSSLAAYAQETLQSLRGTDLEPWFQLIPHSPLSTVTTGEHGFTYSTKTFPSLSLWLFRLCGFSSAGVATGRVRNTKR